VRANQGLLGLGGLILCLLLLALLGWLCREVWEQESFRFDTGLLLWLHGGANPVLDRLMLSLTRLGDPAVVLPVVLASLGLSLWWGKRTEALMLLVTCGGALVLNEGMKLLFARPRPALWVPLIRETSYGFPSGHALGSLVLYGYLAVLLGLRFPHQARRIHLAAVVVILLIGLSRLRRGRAVAGCVQGLKRLRRQRPESS
jgi:undecaprenyl-diphosphatase